MANQVVSLPSNKPDTEVSARPRRRTYTGPYKLKVLDEVAAATGRGAVAVILRREGLYASHLAAWRKELRNGGVAALAACARIADAVGGTALGRNALFDACCLPPEAAHGRSRRCTNGNGCDNGDRTGDLHPVVQVHSPLFSVFIG